jgi:hypothetical protein
MKAKWEREAREKVLKTAQQIEEEYGKLVAANAIFGDCRASFV